MEYSLYAALVVTLTFGTNDSALDLGNAVPLVNLMYFVLSNLGFDHLIELAMTSFHPIFLAVSSTSLLNTSFSTMLLLRGINFEPNSLMIFSIGNSIVDLPSLHH